MTGPPSIATIPSRWVDTPTDLAEISHRLRAPGQVALDTEGDSLHHYPERLSLIQLAVPSSEAWLVDPLAVTDLSSLASVFAAPDVVTVVHAGDNDLVQLKRRGFAFTSIFDTSIAARFLGVSYQCILKWAKEGKLAHVRDSAGRRLFRMADLEQIRESHYDFFHERSARNLHNRMLVLRSLARGL